LTDYLEIEDLLAAADAAVGGSAIVRDVGLLQAALARPRATAFGDEAYPTVDQKAAALLHSIVTSHPLVDGNERLGWVALRLFYALNDIDLRPDPEAAFELVVGVADGSLRDIPQIAALLRGWHR
jgi:death-on-curing protein